MYYTDGSQGVPKGETESTNAAAFVQLSGPERIYKGLCWNLGPTLEVADVEVFAIYKALQHAVKIHGPAYVYVFVDSQAAIHRLNSYHNHITRKIHQLALQLSNQNTHITVRWCPGHCNIYGNEMADHMAKKACLPRFLSKPTLLSVISEGRRKEQTLGNWQRAWASSKQGQGKLYSKVAKLSFSQKPQPPLTPRSLHSAYVQLKTGIGFLKSYFNLIKKAEDSKCFGSCREKQTISHLLLDCELYSEERATLERVLEKGNTSCLLN